MAIPGLPALAAGVIIDAVELITADILAIQGLSAGPQWGLFLNGEPVVVADNVLSFEFKQDYRISNFPVEEGAFETYNKVQVPYDVRLQFSSGGSLANRQALIQSVDAIIGSTDQFDGVTPEKTFPGLNPVHQSIRRTSRNGAGLVIIDLYCEQVRVTATQQFTNSQATGTNGDGTSTQISVQPAGGASSFGQISDPQSPSASPQVSDGTVQPVAPTATQQAQVTQVLNSPSNSTSAIAF